MAVFCAQSVPSRHPLTRKTLLVQGAEAPLSGLVAMLAAADALGRAASASSTPYSRRLVFAALAGEAWDFMGSRRLLWELHAGSDATAGLSLDAIDQVPFPKATKPKFLRL